VSLAYLFGEAHGLQKDLDGARVVAERSEHSGQVREGLLFALSVGELARLLDALHVHIRGSLVVAPRELHVGEVQARCESRIAILLDVHGDTQLVEMSQKCLGVRALLIYSWWCIVASVARSPGRSAVRVPRTMPMPASERRSPLAYCSWRDTWRAFCQISSACSRFLYRYSVSDRSISATG